jgi:hypothetical protein
MSNPLLAEQNADEYRAFVATVNAASDRVAAPGTPSHDLANYVHATGLLNDLERRAEHHRVINEALARPSSGREEAARHMPHCYLCGATDHVMLGSH